MIGGHQRRLERGQLDAVLAAAGIAAGTVDSWVRLGEATFNAAYRVGLADGESLVVKVGPDPTMPTMSYEQGIMRTEALFYHRAAPAVPVPRVVHADFSRRVIDSDVVVMTCLPGENWHARRGVIDAADRMRLRTELGGIVATLHRVTGEGFGYPPNAPQVSWRAAFTAMLAAVLTDAERFRAWLPWPVERVRETVARHAGVLDEVTTPVLVHFDLWPGNILLDSGRISGLVDGERAFWGDPLAEMVSLALFDDVEEDPAFLRGYRSAGGRIRFNEPARRRLALYRCYLYLIMLVEGVPRGYTGAEHEARGARVSEHLVATLRALDA
ncbi:MAG TPA: aminoglycoside phosphotransferase family protein [Mycobacteriales bacterium]|nr:aminoglycoside phosphotransferase family protein [Mycobacteriales bacterium]